MAHELLEQVAVAAPAAQGYPLLEVLQALSALLQTGQVWERGLEALQDQEDVLRQIVDIHKFSR